MLQRIHSCCTLGGPNNGLSDPYDTKETCQHNRCLDTEHYL